jgi:hypothetical protein
MLPDWLHDLTKEITLDKIPQYCTVCDSVKHFISNLLQLYFCILLNIVTIHFSLQKGLEK